MIDAINLDGITIEYLMDSPVKEELDKVFAIYEKALKASLAANNMADADKLTLTKIGTVLSLNLFGTLLGGKKPEEITQDDWKNITSEVIDKAVLMEDQDYSVYVFDLYSQYIGMSAKVLAARVGEAEKDYRIKEIEKLSKEIKNQEKKFRNREITEPQFIENCMWISLDAMIKCMVTHISLRTSDDMGKLIYGAMSFAFEYGRLQLYSKEKAIVEEYLQNQYELDEQLQVKLNAFKRELEEKTEYFNLLMTRAFDSDFRESLKGSVELARASGVKEEEILHDVEEIDDYFLN